METTQIKFEKNGINWLMTIDPKHGTVRVLCMGEIRDYNIPSNISKVEHEGEYVYIYTDLFMYQFKFEDSEFLVGDIFSLDGKEHHREFASHVFGEGIQLMDDDQGNCMYCGEKCYDGQMCDEQQAGEF